LKAQVAHLDAHHECDCVLTLQVIEVLPGVEPPWWLASNPETVDNPPHLPISALFRTRALLAGGGFDPTFRMSEDMELLFRLERNGARLASLPDALVVRRIHGTSASYQTEQMHRDLVRAVRPLTDPSRLPRV